MGQEKAKELPDLEVRSLTVKDKDGKRRAALATLPNGRTQLVFSDANGNMRARLSSGAMTGLALKDRAGKTRVRLGTMLDGAPRLSMWDEDGNSRATLTVFPEPGGSVLDLSDKSGKVIWQAPQD
jgi:hypothetical protein